MSRQVCFQSCLAINFCLLPFPDTDELLQAATFFWEKALSQGKSGIWYAKESTTNDNYFIWYKNNTVLQ